MKNRILLLLTAVMLMLTACTCTLSHEQTQPETTAEPTEVPPVLTENQLGTVDGYDYEIWKDYGNTEMTLTGEATFTCNWEDINNALFRIGRKYNTFPCERGKMGLQWL